MKNQHIYDENFFQYTTSVAAPSAKVVTGEVGSILNLSSVLDVGCGVGAWLKAWDTDNIDIFGLDGEYVNENQLLIDPKYFKKVDLKESFDLDRKFDLVYSLEVAEHLPERSADSFVSSLVRHGSKILFSAAVVGQGGEYHINEQPLEYWRSKFKGHGYHAFDYIRPIVSENKLVQKWYRYNTILYVHESEIKNLPNEILDTRVPDHLQIPAAGDIGWKVRIFLLKRLSSGVREKIAAYFAKYQNLRIQHRKESN